MVDEPKGKSHNVPFTLIRDKGTYGTVTVNFEVRETPETTHFILLKLRFLSVCVCECNLKI